METVTAGETAFINCREIYYMTSISEEWLNAQDWLYQDDHPNEWRFTSTDSALVRFGPEKYFKFWVGAHLLCNRPTQEILQAFRVAFEIVESTNL